MLIVYFLIRPLLLHSFQSGNLRRGSVWMWPGRGEMFRYKHVTLQQEIQGLSSRQAVSVDTVVLIMCEL